MKVFLAGSAEFAIPSLRLLHNDRFIELVAIFSQPPRPRGRGQNVVPTPLAKEAGELGLPVIATENINQTKDLEYIEKSKPDVLLVVAFGQKISGKLLNIPKMGAVNLHASLLPLYRGPCPIQRAIMEGRDKTGVTTMLMDEGWDTGPILEQKVVKILDDDTGGTLHDRLAREGADLLLSTLKKMGAGKITPKPQDEKQASQAPKIGKEEIYLDWEEDAFTLDCKIKAFNPWPVARTLYQDEELRIWKGQPVKGKTIAQPGEIIEARPGSCLKVQAGKNQLRILELQQQGRKRLPAGEFLKGYSLQVGKILGAERK